MCRVDCEVDADGTNVATLKSFVSILESRIPDPLSWEGDHMFASLAERLDVVASLNDRLRELENLGIGAFAASYSENVQKPNISPYHPPEVRAGTLPTPAILTRVVISGGNSDKLVVQKDNRWPVAVWDVRKAPWDGDLDDDVPF
jgi:hypothetical protein